MNYKLFCKYCHTPVKLTNTIAYMKCMCDDEVRTLLLHDIKNMFLPDNLYLLTTEGTDYATLENKKNV